MEVYPQRWVNKYLNMRSNDEIKGPLYNLVTQPENEVFRNQLNEWVNLLPKSAQNKIIPNLQNDNTLIEAYNELRVGDILRRQKYTLEYEKKIDDLTPDWYALDNNNIPFLVEVFSYRSSAVIQLFNKWLADLRDKLRQIPIRVGIHLESFPNPLEAFKIDFRPTRNTILAQELEVWLNQKPKAGETKIFKDMIITILNWNQNYTGIILHGPGYGIWIDEGSLREKIEAKVNKYSGIVQKYGLPLIVAFIPDFERSVKLEELEIVTLGQRTIKVVNGQQIETREPGGLFETKTELSAGAYAYNDIGTGLWKLITVHNPNALIPASIPDLI